jgi:hypothetical protein
VQSAPVSESGFVSTKKDWREWLNFTTFDEHLMHVKVIRLGEMSRGSGREGWRLRYKAWEPC